MHIAELNTGRARHDLDDPRMAGFMDNLAHINALAERSARIAAQQDVRLPCAFG